MGCRLVFQRFQVGVPFYGQKISLLVVAVFTGGDDVALAALATAAQRDDMIHREGLSPYLPMTVMAHALLDPILPPLGLPQASCLLFFPPDVFRGDGFIKSLDNSSLHRYSAGKAYFCDERGRF
ncbi:hypothetical protein TRIP_B110006 [uncultured Desulfatiglans sp.]|uniref:Uncharacterized protein n=1 Tax=Uncultured Desulfatiglans sp. TaxID=1748965 RepID=A0A653A079_UNCDX|nr:hypothetical protein TRIP_B110006 [uncultured Desulfatiglans sp.]